MNSLTMMVFLKISAYFTPIILVIWSVFNHGVNVPFWDDWFLVSLFDKVQAGTVTFNDFFAQHNEHRILFPKFIFVILAFLSKWNLKLQMYFSVLLSAITLYLIYIIAKSGQEKPRKFFDLFNILSGLFLFSLTQDNWFWGFQIAWFLINLCVILAIFCLAVPKNWSPNIRLSLAVFSCFIASFSSAHGLMSWLATIPSIIALQGNSKQKKIRLSSWFIIFAISCLIYSIGYQRNRDLPSLLSVLQKPLIAIKYFLVLLGNSLSAGIQNNRTESGILILAIFLLFNFYALKKIDSSFTRDASAWLSLGWFTILFALITTVGRSGFGWEQAGDGRYITVSVLLPISCLQMWRLFICYNWSWFSKNKSGLFSSYLLAFIIIVLLFYPPYTAPILTKPDTSRIVGKSCLELIHYLDRSYNVIFAETNNHLNRSPRNCLNRIYPNPSQLRNLADITEKLGFRDFPRDIKFNTKPNKNYGMIDPLPLNEPSLILLKNGKITLQGWAAFPEGQQLPEIVLFSYDNQQSFFGNAKVIRKKSGKQVYWSGKFFVKVIPPGEHLIAAWVYDRNGKQFIKLDGEVKVKIAA